MKLVTWNINSARARKERFLGWVDRNRPDVLCLQETKVEDAGFPVDDCRALGYQAALFGQRTYNGVAILSRAPLEDVERGFSDGGKEVDSRFIAATTHGVRVMSVYVPNGQAVGSKKYLYKLEWLTRLRQYLEPRVAADGKLAVCGDFNVAPADLDVHDPVAWQGAIMCSEAERSAVAGICSLGLTDLFRAKNPDKQTFTWWDYRMLAFARNFGLRIDHILVTPPLVERTVGVAVDRNERKGQGASDHAPVIAELAD